MAGWLRDEISDVNMGTGVSGQNEAAMLGGRGRTGRMVGGKTR